MSLPWKIPRLALGAISAVILSLSAISLDARVLEDPTDDDIDYLYRYLAGNPPHFEDEARSSQEYRLANEFDRPAVLNQLVNQMRAVYQGSGDIEMVRLRTSGRLSQYDAENGRFTFDLFRPGTHFPFGRNPNIAIKLTMENAEEFRYWPLSVPDARALRDEDPRGDIIYEIGIRPFAASPSQRNTIRGQVVELRVIVRSTNRVAYERSLDPSEFLPIARAGDANSVAPIDPETHVLQGLRLGISRDDLHAWAEDNGYRTNGDEFSTAENFATESSGGRTSFNFGAMGGGMDLTGVFGRNLNCRGQTDRLERCGMASFETGGKNMRSVALLQSSIGATRDQIIDALIARYGQPTDRFRDILIIDRAFRAEQLVWGISSTNFDQAARNFIDTSGETHWQVEAYITQPETDRNVVIVQINDIPIPDTNNAASGTGQIEF